MISQEQPPSTTYSTLSKSKIYWSRFFNEVDLWKVGFWDRSKSTPWCVCAHTVICVNIQVHSHFGPIRASVSKVFLSPTARTIPTLRVARDALNALRELEPKCLLILQPNARPRTNHGSSQGRQSPRSGHPEVLGSSRLPLTSQAHSESKAHVHA